MNSLHRFSILFYHDFYFCLYNTDTTPLKGVGMRSVDFTSTMAEAGPICKRADDLIPLLKIIVSKTESRLKLDSPVDVKKLHIFYQEGSGDLRISMINAEMRDVFMKAVDYFRDLTGSAQKIKLPGSEYSFRLWRYWMTREGVDFKSDITNRTSRTSATAEIKKLLTRNSNITLAALLKIIDEDFFPKDKKQWAEEVTNNMREYLLVGLNFDNLKQAHIYMNYNLILRNFIRKSSAIMEFSSFHRHHFQPAIITRIFLDLITLVIGL